MSMFPRHPNFVKCVDPECPVNKAWTQRLIIDKPPHCHDVNRKDGDAPINPSDSQPGAAKPEQSRAVLDAERKLFEVAARIAKAIRGNQT